MVKYSNLQLTGRCFVAAISGGVLALAAFAPNWPVQLLASQR